MPKNSNINVRSAISHAGYKLKAAKSAYRGVSFNKSGNPVARIGYNGESFHLGSFDFEEEAAIAYDLAAKKIYGVFARTNILS